MEEIVNRVAKSPLVSIDLEEYLDKGEQVIFDLADVLFQGMILREKDFRQFVKENDWAVYRGKNVGLVCTAEAIVPTWSYMLLATSIGPYANLVTYGDEGEIEKVLIDHAIEKLILENDLDGKKVVIKGCSNLNNTEYANTRIAQKLFPIVSRLMYGEPCSVVPIYKK
ncbi:MAG: DUF2480 family protein [Bacteroidota bacterium]